MSDEVNSDPRVVVMDLADDIGKAEGTMPYGLCAMSLRRLAQGHTLEREDFARVVGLNSLLYWINDDQIRAVSALLFKRLAPAVPPADFVGEDARAAVTSALSMMRGAQNLLRRGAEKGEPSATMLAFDAGEACGLLERSCDALEGHDEQPPF